METLIIIAGALLVAYFVDDGRVRVGVLAALGAFAWWRNRQGILDSSAPPEIEPKPPNTEALDAEIEDTDSRLDSIDDTRPTGNVGAGLDLLDAYDRDPHGK